MKKLKEYDPEVGHCLGVRSRQCLGCLRYALMQMWRGMSPELRESVILMAPRVERGRCRLFMTRGEGE